MILQILHMSWQTVKAPYLKGKYKYGNTVSIYSYSI